MTYLSTRTPPTLLVGIAVENHQRGSPLPRYGAQLVIRAAAMVLPRPRSCVTTDAATPTCTRQAAGFRRACRVGTPNTPLPTHATGFDRLYGLPDHQNVRIGVDDTPPAGHCSTVGDADRRGGADGDQGAQGTCAQSVRFALTVWRGSGRGCTLLTYRYRRRTFIPAIPRPSSAPVGNP